MSRVAPFLFDHEFAHVDDPRPLAERRVASRYTAEDVAAARAEGVREGMDAGLRQAAADAEQRTAAALGAIAEGIDNLNAGLVSHREQTARDTLRAALAMVRALFPALHARSAPMEIAALAQEAIVERGPATKLTIHVAPAVRAALEDQLTTQLRSAGADVPLTLIEDAALDDGDCRIDWPGGGTVRDVEDVWRRIELTLAEVLDSAATDSH